MTESKGFDLAALLGGVSKMDTGGEQIVRLPLDLLDPDPENFYSLDGLDELAANIETVGLLDPIRVRPNGERYTVVSGHRRRAAIQMICDGGSEQFAAGVPCIVEYGEASDAMRKLRLIYANSATRQLTSAEQSRQAEEVTRLLYELKEQGVEFPGRMRDHVAQACNTTKSKLARLHAIRSNLNPALLAFYDSGEMVEDVAYRLSRFPADVQEAIADKLGPIDGKHRKMPVGAVLDEVWRRFFDREAQTLSCAAHAGGPECHHRAGKIVRSVFCQYSWDVCDPDECCMSCYKDKQGCKDACAEGKDRNKLEAAVEAEKEAERKAAENAKFDANARRIVKRAQALLPLVNAAGLNDKKRLFDHYNAATAGEVRKWANGDTEGKTFYSTECLFPQFTKNAKEMAKLLGCSINTVLGLPQDKPAKSEPAPEPPAAVWPTAWQTGEPEKDGWYAVKMRLFEKLLEAPRVFWYGGEWYARDANKLRPIDKAYKIAKWFPLPEEGKE